MAQSPSLAPAPIPFSHYPEEKNRCKKNQQVDRDENGKTDANHGWAGLAGAESGATMSLPHSIVAIAQVR